jgi:hypothetical protein
MFLVGVLHTMHPTTMLNGKFPPNYPYAMALQQNLSIPSVEFSHDLKHPHQALDMQAKYELNAPMPSLPR